VCANPAIIMRMSLLVRNFIAKPGAVGVAIGLALSKPLQNFSGDVMILFFRHFRAADC